MLKIDFKKVMKYDGFLRMLLLNGLVFLAISIYFMVSGAEAEIFQYIFYGVAGLSLIGIVLRYFYLSSFRVDLVEVKATILKAAYYRGIKLLTCTYMVDSVSYKKRYSINYTRTTRDFKKEDEIDILIKETNPKQSLIRDLYFG